MDYPFSRLKKKSLYLLCDLFSVEIIEEIIEYIRYKKLYTCLNKIISKRRIIYEDFLFDHKIDIPQATILINKTQLATLSFDGLVFSTWNLITGKLIYKVDLNNNWISVLCKINNTQIATVTEENIIQIWNINNLNKENHVLKFESGHSKEIISLIKIKLLIISSGEDNLIKIWDLKTGLCLNTLSGHSDRINCLVKINQIKFTSGSTDGSIKIWNSITGVCLKTFTNANYVNSIIKLSNKYLLVK